MAFGKATKRWLPRNLIGEETAYRARVWALWMLIVVAAVGGIAGLLRPQPRPVVPDTSGVTDRQVAARWRAAGFAERFVTTYLSSPGDGEPLTAFLGYTPDLPPLAEADIETPGSARTVEVAPLAEDYWAVTVAVDSDRRDDRDPQGRPPDRSDPPPEGDQAGPQGGGRLWRVGVDLSGGVPVAAALPSLVAVRPAAQSVDLAVGLSAGPVDEPAVEAFAGFLDALLCGDIDGRGDVDRWLAPGVEVAAVEPAVCDEIEVVRWGSDELDGGERRVVAEVDVAQGPAAKRLSYAAVLAERAGRWELAELLSAPPRRVDPEPGTGSGREIAPEAGRDEEVGSG